MDYHEEGMNVDSHPIPRMEDLLTAMSGGLSFSKLDLSHAYLQLQVDESSRDYLIINTHKGLFENSIWGGFSAISDHG